MNISIVYNYGHEVILWHIDISEEEFAEFCERYANRGCSVMGKSYEIADHIADIHR